MQTQIIQIGNSQGIRIPKVLIDELNLSGTIQLTKSDQGLLISSNQPRADWKTAFRKANTGLTNEDKQFLNFPNKFDQDQWQW